MLEATQVWAGADVISALPRDMPITVWLKAGMGKRPACQLQLYIFYIITIIYYYLNLLMIFHVKGQNMMARQYRALKTL